VAVPADAIEIVDTVGAGDSFMAGLLVGLGDAGLLGSARRSALAQLGRDELSGLLRAAGTVAGITCGRRGANSPPQASSPPAASEASTSRGGVWAATARTRCGRAGHQVEVLGLATAELPEAERGCSP
jgi:hypothetical protein